MSAGVVLVTGASGIVGRALVAHFLGKGEQVIAVVRREESATDLETRHDSRRAALFVLRTDFTQPGAARALVDEMEKRSLRATSAVHAARSLESLRIGKGGVVARDAFLNEYLLDVVAPYELTMELALRPGSRLKAVVNIGSQYGIAAANPGLYESSDAESPIQYSVAKAAVIHLTRELAVRLAKRGIRVNCVSYGGIEGRANARFQERYARLCPQGRMLTEADIPGPVDFLVSDASAGTTGHNLVVDGGWTAW